MTEDFISQSIVKIFNEQSQATPNKIALVYAQQKLTYKALNDLADSLANTLLIGGIKPGQPVVFFLQRSPEAIIAMLAILKAGGAYVPIDTSYPPERISFILQDCKPAAILTTHAESKELPATSTPLIFLDEQHLTTPRPENNILPQIAPDDPAYILYTSGTTGTPKGVIVPHRGVIRLVFEQNFINLDSGTVFLQLSSHCFDLTTLEVWGPLLRGGTCILYPGHHIPSPEPLAQLIQDTNISTAWLTSSLFNTLITSNPQCLERIKELIIGGEALSPPHIRKALKDLPDTKLINGYGPTENTTFTTCYQIPSTIPTDWTSIPIGQPLHHTTIHIFDNKLNPVPQGEVGELYTGGDGVALGYLNRPNLTKEKFIANPDPAATDQVLYRTGDLVRQLPDGNLDYVGRIDDQVKIRGFRIELGEINSALLTHPAIKDAVAIVHTDSRQNKHIAAYLLFRDAPTTDQELKKYLGNILPEYIVPTCFIQIESIPLNASGKLDKNKLPQPYFTGQGEYIAPGSIIEKQLAKIWRRILNQQKVSITDNFFDIGGTSLLGIELISIINNKLNPGKELEAVILYQFPTIRTLAQHLEPQKNTSPPNSGQNTRATRQKNSFSKFKKIRRSR